jgi:septal ring factor EnvC (AmiA/AmiB activator)
MMLMSNETSDTTFTGEEDALEAREQAILDSIASAEEAANQAAADAEAAAAQEMRRSDSIAAAMLTEAASYQMNGEPYIVNSEKCYFYTYTIFIGCKPNFV